MRGKRPLSTNDPCSLAAAERIAPRVDSIKTQVLKYVGKHPGATCEQATLDLKLKHQTASARFNDLVAEGKLVFEVRKDGGGRPLRHYRLAGDPRQMEMF